MDRRPLVALGIVFAALLAGCGAPTLPQVTIANRTDAVLTVGPGQVVRACGSTTTSQADYQTAQEKGVEMAINGQTWDAPAGALVWDMPNRERPGHRLGWHHHACRFEYRGPRSAERHGRRERPSRVWWTAPWH